VFVRHCADPESSGQPRTQHFAAQRTERRLSIIFKSYVQGRHPPSNAQRALSQQFRDGCHYAHTIQWAPPSRLADCAQSNYPSPGGQGEPVSVVQMILFKTRFCTLDASMCESTVCGICAFTDQQPCHRDGLRSRVCLAVYRKRPNTILAGGIRRWTPLVCQVAVTAVGCAVILTTTGVVSAIFASRFSDGSDVAIRAFAYTVGQWPAAMAMAGWTALVVGCLPRATWLSWVPLVAGGAIALIGELLGLPQSIRDLGPFQHIPDVTSSGTYVHALLVLVALAVCTSLLSAMGIARRDITKA
jgi:hypothetical protein